MKRKKTGPFKHCMESVKDTATDIEGTITAKYVFSNGCVRYLLEYVDANGNAQEHVVDEQRLELSGGKPVGVEATTGGPRDIPSPRASVPRNGGSK